MFRAYGVTDMVDERPIGILKRDHFKSELGGDQWTIFDFSGELLGGVYESTGRGLAREHIPGLGLTVAMKMTFELHGQEAGHIAQSKKFMGDRWDMDCSGAPRDIDR